MAIDVLLFQKCKTILTAFELGVFSALGDTWKTSHDVAISIGTAPRSTDRLMNALCGIGLLVKNEDRFSNTPLSAEYFVNGKATYLSGLMTTIQTWNIWSSLAEVVREGKPLSSKHFNEYDEKEMKDFIASMHQRACRHTQSVIDLFNMDGVSSVLDIGGGSAAYSMAFVRASEGITATVFELPNVVPITLEYIERERLSDRINVVSGDFHRDEIPCGYDLVFLSSITHHNSAEQNQSLMKKAAAALNPGGHVVVQDFIIDEDRAGPLFCTMFALNMLVMTDCGDAYTESETAAWMKEAGLEDIQRIDIETGTTLIIGWKK